MKELTSKQKEILDYIESFGQENGMSPTVYEVADYFGIKSSTSFAHLKALQSKGYISRSSKARSMSVTHPTKVPKQLSLTLSVPVLGRISAGAPLLAEQNVEKVIQFDPSMLPGNAGGSELFALTVSGESMRDAGLLDGDTLIAEVKHNPKIGDIVVASVDGDTTVKYMYISNGQIELRPANDEFESRFFALDEVQIQGVIVGMQRCY